MQIIALFGPTGVGKTGLAVALAERLQARGEEPPVAVSADALQVYVGLEILTSVAAPAERAALEHRLVSFLPLDATFSVGQYAELAHAEIDGLLAAGRRPLLVGGTGLYLRAALTELDLRPPPPEGARRVAFDFPPVDKDRAWPVVAAMREIGKAHEVSVARVALAWLLAKPHVMSVIIGAKTLEQLDDNLAAVDLTLSAEEIARLDEVSAIPSEYPGWMFARQGGARRPRAFTPAKA